jgi:hypothetical protein
MNKSDQSAAARRDPGRSLSSLLSLDESTPEAWGESALLDMVRHQFAAPLAFDLRGMACATTENERLERALTEAATLGVESFADLVYHPAPPASLLRLAKDFFKAKTREYAKGSAEWQVAYFFYLVSIAAAGSRLSEVSTLEPGELRKGIGWALNQTWVDERTRRLLGKMAKDGA